MDSTITRARQSLGEHRPNPRKVWSVAELLAIAFAHPPNFAPGTAFEYDNTNYALLGLIAEKVDDKPLAQVMHDRLFGPLRLQQTVLPAPADNAIPIRYSHGYMYGSSSVALVGSPPYSPEVQAAARAGTLMPKRLHRREPLLCRRGRRGNLHRPRTRNMDPGVSVRWRPRCHIPAPLA